MRGDYYIFQNVVWNQWIVAQGIFAASISTIAQGIIIIIIVFFFFLNSSSRIFVDFLGMTGASRILQAIARDDLIPGFWIFKQGSKIGDEPQIALAITYLVVAVSFFQLFIPTKLLEKTNNNNSL